MSLVPTWVYAQDGKWYEDPVVSGPNWYVCFDDDDPPELVIAAKIFESKGMLPPVLDWFRPDPRQLERVVRRALSGRPMHTQRHFTNGFRPAYNLFGVLIAPIPVPSNQCRSLIGPHWPKPRTGECAVAYDLYQCTMEIEAWRYEHPGYRVPEFGLSWLQMRGEEPPANWLEGQPWPGSFRLIQ